MKSVVFFLCTIFFTCNAYTLTCSDDELFSQYGCLPKGSCPRGKALYGNECIVVPVHLTAESCFTNEVFSQYGCLEKGLCPAGYGMYQNSCVPSAHLNYASYGLSSIGQCPSGTVPVHGPSGLTCLDNSAQNYLHYYYNYSGNADPQQSWNSNYSVVTCAYNYPGCNCIPTGNAGIGICTR